LNAAVIQMPDAHKRNQAASCRAFIGTSHGRPIDDGMKA
jgi:hypothetical protein